MGPLKTISTCVNILQTILQLFTTIQKHVKTIRSLVDRVSGRRELLPSASEQILSPLRFQETRGGSGACHFGFKAGFSVVAALLRDSLLWGFLMDSADRGKPLTCESRRRSRSAGCSSCSTGRATPPAGLATRTAGHLCRPGAQLRRLPSG